MEASAPKVRLQKRAEGRCQSHQFWRPRCTPALFVANGLSKRADAPDDAEQLHHRRGPSKSRYKPYCCRNGWGLYGPSLRRKAEGSQPKPHAARRPKSPAVRTKSVMGTFADVAPEASIILL